MNLAKYVPQYGNYGGRGHSGERKNPDGTLTKVVCHAINGHSINIGDWGIDGRGV